MMNYWYVAHPNELFLDIDNAARSLPHAKARLQGAIECGKLDVAYVMQRPSNRKGHIHVIVTLNKALIFKEENVIWEIILHGDLYRGCSNVMRCKYNIASSILISPYSLFKRIETVGGLRIADDSCGCETKHNAVTMETCPAAIRLRGEYRNAGFFGKPSKNPCTIWPELDLSGTKVTL